MFSLTKPIAAASLIVAFDIFGATFASARDFGLDPSLPHRVRVGAPRGGAPMAGLDARNSGTSRFAFPVQSRARVVWQTRVSGGIPHAPAADERGHVIIAQGTMRVTELDGQGKVLWSTRLGTELATGPIITSNGMRVVATLPGELIALSPDGRVRMRKQVADTEIRPRALLIALGNGGVALADGRDVYTVDAFLELSWKAKTKELVRTLLEDGGDVLAITDAGSVHRFRSENGFNSIGQLPGRVVGGAVLGPGKELIAIVDEHKLATIHLTTDEVKIRAFDQLLTLRGPPAVLPNGSTRMLSSDGLLLFHDKHGQETQRIPLDAPVRGSSARAEHAAARFICDPNGSVAIASASRDALIVASDGGMQRIQSTACPDPLRPTPLSAHSLLLSCKSGMMWRVDGHPAKK